MGMYCYSGFKDIAVYTPEQMSKMKTRQLLAHLRSTYTWGCTECWDKPDWDELGCYRAQIKNELATREHIPNKIESKKIRIARKKKGN